MDLISGLSPVATPSRDAHARLHLNLGRGSGPVMKMLQVLLMIALGTAFLRVTMYSPPEGDLHPIGDSPEHLLVGHAATVSRGPRTAINSTTTANEIPMAATFPGLAPVPWKLLPPRRQARASWFITWEPYTLGYI